MEDDYDQIKKHECEVCNKVLCSKTKLIEHSLSHVGVTVFHCKACDHLFMCAEELEQHESAVHLGAKDYVAVRYSIGQGTKRIGEHEPYRCEECGKTFAVQTSLLQHMNLHTKDKSYTCTECNKSFPYSYGLLVHRSTRTCKKRFSCDECGQSFALKKLLNVHKQLHRVDVFPCKVCDHLFMCAEELEQHKHAVHPIAKDYVTAPYDTMQGTECRAEEKPYSWEDCGKTYKFKKSLFRHMNLHTKGKRYTCYTCTECNKSFPYSYSFFVHRSAHTPVRRDSAVMSVGRDSCRKHL